MSAETCPCCLGGEIESEAMCPVCEGLGFIIDDTPTPSHQTGQRCSECGTRLFVRQKHPRLYCDFCGRLFPDTEG